jgi:hypothetical protein
MKTVLIALLFVFTAATADAQTSLEDYLNRLPAQPKQCCGVAERDKAAFRDAISTVEDAMGKDLRERKKASKARMETDADKIEESLTPQTMDKPRKSGKLTREEKKARKEEMMRQYGISPEDTQKLKTMTKEEKTAWALKNSSAASQKMQNDPKYAGATVQIKSLADQQAAQRAAQEQVDTQKALLDGILKKIDALEKTASATYAGEVGPVERELSAIPDIVTTREQQAQVGKLDSKLKAARARHCKTYAPKYLALVSDYLAALQAALPDFRKLDEAGRMQVADMDAPVESHDGMAQGVKAIKTYGHLLGNAFKYDR